MRIIGLDYGTKTVGVAVSDALGITAQGLETITRKEENKLRRTLARIEELIGERGNACKEFAEKLERRTGIEVVMWDERLSTVSANNVLIESGVRREQRKAVIDKIAAVFILQGYLDYLANQSKED